MVKFEFPRENLGRCALRFSALLLTACVAASGVRGHAAVGTAQGASNFAGIASQATQAPPSSVQTIPAQNNSAKLPAPAGPTIAETNRKALEAGAGKDAAKLLLRSVPSQATIYIDGTEVGDTPLLLMIRPGKHKVEMRGQSEEFGERVIELSPSETEEVALTLTLRYPASISVHPGASPSSVANFVTVTGAVLVPKTHAGEENTTEDAEVWQDSSLAEANRKTFEQGAGKDAAKLQLQSAPAAAMIYVDALFVGRAPQLVTLLPGKHKVEMRGQHGEFGERLVGLLPSETQQVTLTLTVRYPASISVR